VQYSIQTLLSPCREHASRLFYNPARALLWGYVMKEEWRPSPIYSEGYSVSNHGRVRSEKKTGGSWVGKIIIPARTQSGYHHLGLCLNGIRSDCRVHRLVAFAFLGDPPTASHEVNHMDCNKINNHISNLEWVTKSENLMHSLLNNARPGQRISAFEVLEIKYLLSLREMSHGQIGDEFGISRTQVSCINSGKSWGWFTGIVN